MQPYENGTEWYNSAMAMEGSFAVNGVISPTLASIRDGNSNNITSVTRVSAGLFRVKIAGRFPLPFSIVTAEAWVQPKANATVTTAVVCGVVTDSFNRSARTFDILTTQVDTAASGTVVAVAADPDDTCRIGFRLKGSMNRSGKD